MREGRAAVTARTARRGSHAVSRVAVREAIAFREAIAASRVVTVVAGFHHASSPPPRRAPCRRRHCSVTREGRTREETEPRGSSATKRGDARQICRRGSAHRHTTSPTVKLSLSPLPEVAIGAAVPLLSFFFLQLASAPAMFNSTLTKDEAFLCPIDGSIMITASHLPFNRNGFKFFTNAGGLGKTDIKDVLERATDIYNQFTAESLANSERKASSSIKQVDYMNVYTSDLVKAVRKAAGSIEKPLGGFHIVVDASNGPNAEVQCAFESFSKLNI